MSSLKGKVLTGMESIMPGSYRVWLAITQFCVNSVTGAVEPKELGNVLPHEYTLLRSLWALKDAEYGTPTDLADLTFELKNLGKIRQFP